MLHLLPKLINVAPSLQSPLLKGIVISEIITKVQVHIPDLTIIFGISAVVVCFTRSACYVQRATIKALLAI